MSAFSKHVVNNILTAMFKTATCVAIDQLLSEKQLTAYAQYCLLHRLSGI